MRSRSTSTTGKVQSQRVLAVRNVYFAATNVAFEDDVLTMGSGIPMWWLIVDDDDDVDRLVSKLQWMIEECKADPKECTRVGRPQNLFDWVWQAAGNGMDHHRYFIARRRYAILAYLFPIDYDSILPSRDRWSRIVDASADSARVDFEVVRDVFFPGIWEREKKSLPMLLEFYGHGRFHEVQVILDAWKTWNAPRRVFLAAELDTHLEVAVLQPLVLGYLEELNLSLEQVKAIYDRLTFLKLVDQPYFPKAFVDDFDIRGGELICFQKHIQRSSTISTSEEEN